MWWSCSLSSDLVRAFSRTLYVRERERRVQLLLSFSVSVQALRDLPNVLLLGVRAGREWERIEAASLYVDRFVTESDASAIRCCPGKMDSTREDTEVIGVLKRDCDEFIIR